MVITVKMWILYKNGIGFSRIIAELIQDYLDEFIDTNVGSAKKIDPSFLLEEKLDYLIIGDIISKEIPSLEMQNWLLKFKEISKKQKITLKGISGFYIVLPDINSEPFWTEFIYDNVKAEIIHPPILRLKLKRGELELENGAHDMIKEYSTDFIKFLVNSKDK